MDNGATTSNPFLVQLVPITMSSEFIMQLILAQSCAHRAIKQSEIVGTDVAVQYNKAVCALRLAVDKFVTQTGHVDPLILTVGILVMCFTEVSLLVKSNQWMAMANITRLLEATQLGSYSIISQQRTLFCPMLYLQWSRRYQKIYESF